MARLFLDGGLQAAEDVIRRLFEPRIVALPAPETLKDAKTRLQEYLQSRGHSLPRYTVDHIEGEAHAQTFHVTCDVPDIGRRSQGQGLEPPPCRAGGRRADHSGDRGQVARAPCLRRWPSCEPRCVARLR